MAHEVTHADIKHCYHKVKSAEKDRSLRRVFLKPGWMGSIEVLNQQYCSVFTREYLAFLPEVEQNFSHSEDEELQDIKFTREKVRVALSKLKPISAPGPVQIWPRVRYRIAAAPYL